MLKILFVLLFVVSSLFGCSTGEREAKPQPESANLNGKSVEVEENSDKQEKGLNEKVVDENALKQKAMLDVPIIAQNPELKYGCEVTSLAMVLQHAGVKVDKMQLARKIEKDSDPVRKSRTGDIIRWGNPDHGFVGDITGKSMGYAVNNKPLQELMEQYLPGRIVNVTGKSFDAFLRQVAEGKPVVVWTTGDFLLPDRWESWRHGAEQIRVPLDLHAVVLVGYDPDHVYVNDPLTGKKGYKVDKQTFIKSWVALGKQGLSYR